MEVHSGDGLDRASRLPVPRLTPLEESGRRAAWREHTWLRHRPTTIGYETASMHCSAAESRPDRCGASGRSRPNPRSSTPNDRQERTQCGIGRPSKVAPFRALVQARLDGYEGGKSAIYELIAELRPHAAQLTMRFEGLPGEFSQHDFAEVRITYVDGSS